MTKVDSDEGARLHGRNSHKCMLASANRQDTSLSVNCARFEMLSNFCTPLIYTADMESAEARDAQVHKWTRLQTEKSLTVPIEVTLLL